MDKQKDHGPQIKDDEQYETLRMSGESKEKAVRIANSARNSVGGRGEESPRYHDSREEELFRKARGVGLEWRSRMSKRQLIDALRNH
jgi:hypothetical protein